MAALFKRSYISILAVILVFAVCIHAKPASSTEKEASKSKASDSKLNIDSLPEPASQESDKKSSSRETIDKPEKSKAGRGSPREDESIDKKASKSNEDAKASVQEKANKKSGKSEEKSDSKEYSDVAAGPGWDESTILSDSSAGGDSAEQRDDSDNKDATSSGAKNNETSNKSKSGKRQPAEDSEPLPSPAGQQRPTTPAPHSTTPHANGSASNLPRALCAFLVTVSTTVLLLL